MNAPNRAADVAAVVAAHAPVVETPEDNERRDLLYDIVRALNVKDGGEWGVLVKTDQADKIPADIIVWRSTMEHFDVLTGDLARATWNPAGVISNPAWMWRSVPGVGPIPPPDDDEDDGDLLALLAEIKALREDLAVIKASLPIVFPDYRANNRWLGSITLTPVQK